MDENQTQTGPDIRPASGGALADRAILVSIAITRFGTRKRVKASQIQTDADRTMLHISKDIFESPDFKTIARFDNDTRRTIWAKALPTEFRSGVYAVLFDDVVKMDEYLETRMAERSPLVETALSTLDDLKKDAEARLGSLYNERDYPLKDEIRRAYTMEWQWIELGPAGKLKTISEKLLRREQEKAAAQAVNEIDQIKLALRDGVAEVFEHLVDRLTPSTDGKKKVFRDSLITNAMEFFSDVEHKITAFDDADLAALVTQAKEVLEGSTPKDLRGDEGLRDFTRESVANLKATLDGMLKDAPRRKFFINDDESGEADAAAPA